MRPAPPVPFDPAALDDLVGAAAEAVTVLPYRPWRLAAGPDGVEVHADRPRHGGGLLDVACGAAVLAVRLGLRRAGVQPVVRLAPRSESPSLLATLRIAGPLGRRLPEDRFWQGPGAGAAQRPAGAGTPAAVRGLAEEAALEGARLVLLPPAQVPGALALLDEAAWALGTAPVDERGLRGPGPAGELPLLATVCTDADTRAGRLRAGAALARIALAARELGLAATPLAQPWECGRTAARTGALTSSLEVAHVLVHLGRGGAAGRADGRPAASAAGPR